MRVQVAGHDVYVYTGTRALDAARPTVLFVHGAANDHGVFALQSRYFAWHGLNVVAPDLPAHGRSAGNPLPSVEAIAEWMIATLDAMNVAKAAVVGHSLGSLAALECAARHPERVERLVLIGPSVPMAVNDELLDAAARNDHIAYELINSWSFSSTGQLGGNQVPGMWLLGNAMRLIERCRDGVLSTDLLACHRYANGLQAAAAVHCATLVVIGARDVMAPPRNADALAAALRDVQKVTLSETGHAIMAERPGEVLDALRAFLANARPNTRQRAAAGRSMSGRLADAGEPLISGR